jgi:flavin reductase (DIM6/NTAB) family NADH-FMN oxidoreductase RutF
MKRINPSDLNPHEILALLIGGVSPRPIALVSTLSKDGIPNLAPFSFFNAFGSNPPTVAFSPARRGRDGTTKDTYENLMATKECVVQIVTFDMVNKVNISSKEFPPEVDEFIESGLTPIPSEIVKAARVKESPYQMECTLTQMVTLGDKPGSGNLAICEVKLFHVNEDLFENGIIQPDKLDSVARNGGNFYTRASGDAIFELEKP